MAFIFSVDFLWVNGDKHDIQHLYRKIRQRA